MTKLALSLKNGYCVSNDIEENLYPILVKNRKGITADPSISQVPSNSVIPFLIISIISSIYKDINNQN